MTIAPALAKELRQAFGLDVAQMARLVGTSARQWSRYEAGATKVPLGTEILLITILRYENVRRDMLEGLK